MSVAEVLSGERRWCVEEGDSLAVLQALPDSSVDAVITDAPYSSGGMFRGDRQADPSTKYVQSGVQTVRPEFAGDNRDQRSYAYWCALWLSECLRVARSGAPICLFSELATTPRNHGRDAA